MRKIVNFGCGDFVDIDFEAQTLKELPYYRSMELVKVIKADADLTIELKDSVTEVAKGDIVAIMKYYDKEYKHHYKVIPLEGVAAHDMLELSEASIIEKVGTLEPDDKDEPAE